MGKIKYLTSDYCGHLLSLYSVRVSDISARKLSLEILTNIKYFEISAAIYHSNHDSGGWHGKEHLKSKN